MRAKRAIFCGAVMAVMTSVVLGGPPAIVSLQKNGTLAWTNSITNGIAVIQRTTNLQTSAWSPFYYDSGGYSRTSLYPYPYYLDVAMPTVRTTLLPSSSAPAAFFRLALQTNAPDPSLLMHLSFDNDFVHDRVVLDSSGHGNHGLAYGRPGYPTNWPSAIHGPDGSQAAEFHRYLDGWGDYGTSGDYVGIPTLSDLAYLPQATISVWCHFYPFTAAGCDCNATLLQAGYYQSGAWTLGRQYATNTTFYMFTSDISGQIVLRFPDDATSSSGDTGGWHHYAVTYDRGAINGYFDGTNIGSVVVFTPALTIQGYYLSIAGWTFGEAPWMDDSLPTKHPNNAWINGAVDDVRIYNRILSPVEVLNLYSSFDKQPPSVPQNLRAKTDSSTQIELYWDASSDNFRVDGYRIRRNGVLVGTAKGTRYVDTDLSAQTLYSYTVQAYDPAGNVSLQSLPATTNTPAAGSGVEVILDDAYGPPWISVTGSWDLYAGPVINDFYGNGVLFAGTGTPGSVIFRPNLPESGNYSVYLWHPGRGYYYEFAANAPVAIAHNGTTNTVYVNEQTNFGMWDLLGTFAFAAGTNGFVEVIPVPGIDIVPADAVRFVK